MSRSSAHEESGSLASRIGFAIVLCGEDLRIRSWNDRAERSSGGALRQGQDLSEAFGDSAARGLQEACRTAVTTGETSHAVIGDCSPAPATICPVPGPGGGKNALILWSPADAGVPSVPCSPPVADACLEDPVGGDCEGTEDENLVAPGLSGKSRAPSASVGAPRPGSSTWRNDSSSPSAQAVPASATTAVSTSESTAVELGRELESIESLVASLCQNRTLSPDARERLQKIRGESSWARTLVDRARRAAEPPVPVRTRAERVPRPAETVCDLEGTIDTIRERLRGEIERRNARIHVLGPLPPATFLVREAESLFESLIRFGLAEGDGVAQRLEIGCLAPDHPRALPDPGFRTFFVADNAGYGGGMAGPANTDESGSDALAVSSAGAGLAVARRLVERHGGQLWIELDVGRGSRTYFTLPCAG